MAVDSSSPMLQGMQTGSDIVSKGFANGIEYAKAQNEVANRQQLAQEQWARIQELQKQRNIQSGQLVTNTIHTINTDVPPSQRQSAIKMGLESLRKSGAADMSDEFVSAHVKEAGDNKTSLFENYKTMATTVNPNIKQGSPEADAMANYALSMKDPTAFWGVQQRAADIGKQIQARHADEMTKIQSTEKVASAHNATAKDIASGHDITRQDIADENSAERFTKDQRKQESDIYKQQDKIIKDNEKISKGVDYINKVVENPALMNNEQARDMVVRTAKSIEDSRASKTIKQDFDRITGDVGAYDRLVAYAEGISSGLRVSEKVPRDIQKLTSVYKQVMEKDKLDRLQPLYNQVNENGLREQNSFSPSNLALLKDQSSSTQKPAIPTGAPRKPTEAEVAQIRTYKSKHGGNLPMPWLLKNNIDTNGANF